MSVDKILANIVEKKYKELHLGEENQGLFAKIKFFEANAIGQIGESFIKTLFKNQNLPMDDERKVVHDEYDILSNGLKIEIKTARKGLKNDTFQFNGINPAYNHDYIILIGLTSQKAYYRIIKGKTIYKHEKRRTYIEVNSKLRQLVAMNPGNSVNYKLTVPLCDLLEIDTLEESLRSTFRKS